MGLSELGPKALESNGCKAHTIFDPAPRFCGLIEGHPQCDTFYRLNHLISIWDRSSLIGCMALYVSGFVLRTCTPFDQSISMISAFGFSSLVSSSPLSSQWHEHITHNIEQMGTTDPKRRRKMTSPEEDIEVLYRVHRNTFGGRDKTVHKSCHPPRGSYSFSLLYFFSPTRTSAIPLEHK